ncbi:hypothetical protein [Rodentibacter trehalosifermentans]|uniref:hypothetical protein n=1 Tax=Rodentibacter trehalosifermentans TaxID=1908263 RepID=UPI00130153A1|nr:hypothetical protein [Rodentibacter trehalosifermentans]
MRKMCVQVKQSNNQNITIKPKSTPKVEVKINATEITKCDEVDLTPLPDFVEHWLHHG